MLTEKIEIRMSTVDEIKEYLWCFEKDTFYYGTKRPDTTKPVERLKALENSMLLLCNGETVGIAKIWEQKRTLYSKVRLAFFDEKLYSNELGRKITSTFLENCNKIYNHNGTVILEIFAFDELMKSHCDSLGLTKVGALRDRIFKFGRYHDVIIYSYI